MIVFKLSWLPYMLIIAGIAVVAEGQPAGLIFIAIGGIWLYFKYKNKKSGTTSQSGTASSTSKPAATNNTVNSAPKAVPSAPKAVETVQSAPKAQSVEPAKPVGKFCRHCGAKVEPDDVYCIECGEKL